MRRFYDWFHVFYGLIERTLGGNLDAVLSEKVSVQPDIRKMTALEYACGSGLLTRKLARIFHSVEGRDLSVGMMGRARKKNDRKNLNITCREGNLLDIREDPKSFDFVFISFALHLFSPEDETVILKNLLSVAREAIIIIDHSKNWNPFLALIEWFEGSHYDRFIRIDFAETARRIGAAEFEETEIRGCRVLTFRPGSGRIA